MSQSKILIAPQIEVKHRLPLNMAQNDIEEFQGQVSYKTYDAYLKRIDNARVSPDSVVYQNGSIIKETLASADHYSYYRMRHLFKKILTGNKVRLDDNKKYLLVTDLWSAGHFHWFVDVLPKLLSLPDGVSEYVLLLPDNGYIKKIGLESLDLMGMKFADIIFMNESSFYKAKNLYYISKVSKSGQMHPEIMKRMRQKFVTKPEPATKKIYISREKAAFRKLVNEREFVKMIQHHGFETLLGEELSLAEQVKIFSSAETLLGLHGAGLTNCIFMQPGKNMIELRKKKMGQEMLDTGTWQIQWILISCIIMVSQILIRLLLGKAVIFP